MDWKSLRNLMTVDWKGLEYAMGYEMNAPLDVIWNENGIGIGFDTLLRFMIG